MKIKLLVPLILLIHLILLVNTRFTLWPEMIVYPYLSNNGYQLYRDIINPYSPTFLVLLSQFEKLFKTNILPYQILTWVITLSTDLLIFYFAKNLYKKTSWALFAMLFFVIFSLPFGVNGLWFDLVQTPLILASIYFFDKFLKDTKSKNLIWTSLLLTIAIFVKQQAIWLTIFISVYFLFSFKKGRISVLLSNKLILLPPAFFLLVHLVLLSKNHILKDFLFWAVYFPFFKASSMPGYLLLPTLKQLIPIGLLIAVFAPVFYKLKFQKVFLLASLSLLLFAYPRFDYFHLIPGLAVLSLTSPKFLEAQNFKKQYFVVPATCFILLLVFTARYMSRNWTRQVRFFESDIYQAADFLKYNTKITDYIYVQNGPDQILALSNRLPPKPWADEFPWYLEIPNEQDKILDGIKTYNPTYVVLKPYDQGYYFDLGTYRPTKIADYLDANYQNNIQINQTLWLKVKK